ncbi:unnamed protein product [Soboliphyme baturini]|uniref:Carrier protein n=1 Tax=Soboliphyme baturini TaxID=241478 RepID=A0A183ILC0_9BILA|nr:unnamed protein product [Soboliphyme baturini]
MRITSDQRLDPAQNFVIAGTAAAVGRLAANPFSVAKIWGEAGRPGGKMGPVMALYWIGRSEGLMNTPMIAAPSVERSSSIFFWGGVGNIVATTLTHPLDVIKTRLVLQSNRSVYANSWDAVVKILKQENIFGLYRGLAPSLVGGFVFSGSMFALWDLGDNLPWRRRNAKRIIVLEWFTVPCLAVALACTISHPFDVLRRKIMATGKSLPNGTLCDVAAPGFFPAVMKTLRKNGLPGFLHGLVSNWLKVIDHCA